MDNDLKKLTDRVTALEQQAFGPSPLTHPLTVANLQQQINIPYTTGTPTYLAGFNGVRTIYFDGSKYWLYVFANGAWKKVQLT